MAFVKKTWKDRIAEFPTRRRLTKEDNTSELVTVAREEGTLSQEGDAFSAENMNDLENRIDAEFTELNGKLSWKPLIPKKTITGDFSDFSNIDISNKSELLIIYGCPSGQTISEILPVIALNNLFYDTISACNYAPSQSCVIFSCNGNKISLFATMYNGISDTTNKKTLAIYFR